MLERLRVVTRRRLKMKTVVVRTLVPDSEKEREAKEMVWDTIADLARFLGVSYQTMYWQIKHHPNVFKILTPPRKTSKRRQIIESRSA